MSIMTEEEDKKAHMKAMFKKELGIKDGTKNTIVKQNKEEQFLEKVTVAGKIILECIQNGLSELDGCTLSGLSIQDYEKVKESAPGFRRLIEKAKIQYKLDLMKPITAAIKNGEVTKAMWIAERRFPAEFGASSKRLVAPVEDDRNPIAEIVYLIQNGEKPKGMRIVNSDILDL